jgi:hypothetical protein
MSKTWEHYRDAARHHEGRPPTTKGGKFDQAEEHEEAAHHASLAHGHNLHAIDHNTEAAKPHAEHRDSVVTTANERDTKKNAA